MSQYRLNLPEERPHVTLVRPASCVIAMDDTKLQDALGAVGTAQVEEQILVHQLEESKRDEDPDVGSIATCRHCLGEAHGPDDKRTRKLLCPAWGF